MPNVTKRELHVFRGTYAECMAQQTEDLEVYLSWDTQEIFIGNKHGVKVKYGGSQGIQTELEKYFSAFRSEVYDQIDKYSEESVSTQVAQSIKSFDDKYSNQFDAIKSELSSQIQSLQRTIENTADTINATRNSLNSLTTDYNNYKRTINSNISSMQSQIQNNSTSISNVNNRVSILESNPTSEIPEYDRSLSGKVLSVDRNGNLTWVKMGTGTITKENHTSTLNLTIPGFSSNYEVSSDPIVYSSISYGSTNSTLGGAIDGSIKLMLDGREIDSVSGSNTQSIITKTYGSPIIIDRSVAANHIISVIANTLENTDEINYSVSEVSKNINVYIPSFIMVDNKVVAPVGESVNSENRFIGFSNKAYPVNNLSAGQTIKFYSPMKFSGMTMSGFTFVNYETSTETYNINGINCDYNVYSFPYEGEDNEVQVGVVL